MVVPSGDEPSKMPTFWTTQLANELGLHSLGKGVLNQVCESIYSGQENLESKWLDNDCVCGYYPKTCCHLEVRAKKIPHVDGARWGSSTPLIFCSILFYSIYIIIFLLSSLSFYLDITSSVSLCNINMRGNVMVWEICLITFIQNV